MRLATPPVVEQRLRVRPGRRPRRSQPRLSPAPSSRPSTRWLRAPCCARSRSTSAVPSQSGRSNGSTALTSCGAGSQSSSSRSAERAYVVGSVERRGLVVGEARRRGLRAPAPVDQPGDALGEQNSTVIGMASMIIENGSVDGVATAAKTKVPRTIQGR